MSFLVSLRKEFLELARTNRLLILAAVLLVFGLLSPLIAKYTPEVLSLLPEGEKIAQIIPQPTMLDAVAQFIKNTNQFGIVLALLLAMGAVAQEKEKSTAALMLVKPISRGAFLAAKFVALGLAFLGSLALASLGAYFYTAVLFATPDAAAWLSTTSLVLVEILAYLALMLLFSTLVRSQAAAIGLGLTTLLLFTLLGSLPGVADYLPARLTVWGSSLFTGQPAPAWAALWTSLGIILVSLVVAWAAFEQQEL